MANNDEYVIEILQDTGLVTKSQLDHAKAEATPKHGIIETLVEQGVVTQEDVTRALAAHANMDFVDLSAVSIPTEVIESIPHDVARRYKVVPIAQMDGSLMVAIGDPLNFDTFDNLNFLLKRDVEFVCSTPAQIKTALIKYYGTAEDAAAAMEGQLGEGIDVGGEAVGDSDAPGESGGDAPVIKMVTMLLLEAHKMRASDIHLEPLEKTFRVRFRVDGVLHEMQAPPKKLQSAVTSRLKIMTGSMSIAEKRLPQDGR
ncbi:MAG: type pilus assembly protein PilB, partial [Chthoniobacter sp.]|nr:type pilus assembly protein PilB [Chthoniobacter sp.]